MQYQPKTQLSTNHTTNTRSAIILTCCLVPSHLSSLPLLHYLYPAVLFTVSS